MTLFEQDILELLREQDLASGSPTPERLTDLEARLSDLYFSHRAASDEDALPFVFVHAPSSVVIGADGQTPLLVLNGTTGGWARPRSSVARVISPYFPFMACQGNWKRTHPYFSFGPVSSACFQLRPPSSLQSTDLIGQSEEWAYPRITCSPGGSVAGQGKARLLLIGRSVIGFGPSGQASPLIT